MMGQAGTADRSEPERSYGECGPSYFDTMIKVGRGATLALYDLNRMDIDGGMELVDGEVVTSVDEFLGYLMSSFIQCRHPEVGVIGEDCPEFEGGDTGLAFALDPVDGSGNMGGGLDDFATSVGLMRDVEIIGGYIGVPERGEEYIALDGCGTYRNGQPVEVQDGSLVDDGQLSIVMTRLLSDRTERVRESDFYLNEAILGVGNAVQTRDYGSFAYNLTQVARGNATGFVTNATKLPDVAAGLKLVDEAGGECELILQEGPLGHPMAVAANNSENLDRLTEALYDSIK